MRGLSDDSRVPGGSAGGGTGAVVGGVVGVVGVGAEQRRDVVAGAAGLVVPGLNSEEPVRLAACREGEVVERALLRADRIVDLVDVRRLLVDARHDVLW